MKRFAILLVLCSLVGCKQSVERDTFLFPIHEENDRSAFRTLSPELVLSAPLNLSGYSVRGETLITTADFMGEYCLEMYDLSSGELIMQFCRKGRGPGEFLAVSPMFSESKGILSLYDAGTGNYSELDLSSDDTNILKSARLSSPDGVSTPIIMSTFRLSDEKVLAYNSIQSSPEFVSIDNPYYAVYDTSSGQEIRKYDLFDATALRESSPNQMVDLGIADCLSNDRSRLCFALNGMPIVAFLDLESGKASGVRVKGAPSNDPDAPMTFFSSVCSDQNYVYALYYGKRWEELIPGQINTMLYIFDWDGNILAKYSMDGLYNSCRMESGTLYLSKTDSDMLMRLYKLDSAVVY